MIRITTFGWTANKRFLWGEKLFCWILLVRWILLFMANFTIIEIHAVISVRKLNLYYLLETIRSSCSRIKYLWEVLARAYADGSGWLGVAVGLTFKTASMVGSVKHIIIWPGLHKKDEKLRELLNVRASVYMDTYTQAPLDLFSGTETSI